MADNKLDASSFIREFHCIDGIKIKDRQHNLHQQFRKYSKLNSAELDTICLDLKPKTHLEKIFRIDFLIYFKRVEELYKEFQSGDEITTCKVAKHHWFFKQSFEKFSADEFVNSVLPTMSYSTRMKILKRFNGSEEQNDAIFDALKLRYGLFKSSVWLTKCSAKKIKEILKEYPNFRLTENQLKAIFEKDKNLIMFYYERFEYDSDSNHKSLLALIAKNDPEMLLELLQKHKNFGEGIDLGRRNTCHFITAKKKEILEKPEDFFHLLNQSALRRKLGADSIVFLEKIFPTKVIDVGEDLYEDMDSFTDTHNFLLNYPPKIRFKTFKTVYKNRFNENFGEDVSAIREDILKNIIFDKFEREKYAFIKYNKTEDINVLAYITPERCFNEFTSKMSKMEMKQRATFIRVLTNCCIINRDFETILKVGKLVSNRFKNDDYQIHSNFISSLRDIKIIKFFNEEHFKIIFKIFANDTPNHIHLRSEFYFGYFEYLVREKKPLKQGLFKAPLVLQRLFISQFNDAKVLKPILLELLASPIPKEVKHEDNEDYVNLYELSLIRCCVDYSKKYPNDKFKLLDYENTRNAMHRIFQMEWSAEDELPYIEYVVKNTSSSDVEFIKFTETIFKHLKQIKKAKIIVYMFREHPQLVEKHFDQFLEDFKEVGFIEIAALWRLIKKLSHLGFDKRVVEFCVRKLNSEESVDGREDYILPLSILMEPESCRNFIQRFMPEETKVNLEDEEKKRKYLIQLKILSSFTHFEHPISVLPLVLEFCKRDFLKYALKTLYSNMFRLQEDKTKEFIKKLNQIDALSVRKHGLYLCCEISDVKTILQTLKTSSLSTVLSGVRYLKKNPSKQCWELVESKLNKLTKTDVPIFKTIVKLGVPQEFTGKFVELMWKIFEKYDIKKYNTFLLKKVDKKTIKQVSKLFMNDLILNHLFEAEELDDFFILLLLHNDETIWYENFLTSLKNIKEKQEKKFAEKINNLIKKFYGEYLKEENETNLELIKKFTGDFTRIFKIVEDQFFEEYVILELCKQKGESIQNIAESILKFQLELLEKYSELIIHRFHGIFKTITMNSIVSDKEQLNFCTEVLKRAQNRSDYLLVIHLLPNQLPQDVSNNLKYTAIVNNLKSVNDFVVKIFLNNYFKLLP